MSELWIFTAVIAVQGITLLFILYYIRNQDKLSVSEWREVINNTREDLEPLIKQDMKSSIHEALKPYVSSFATIEEIKEQILMIQQGNAGILDIVAKLQDMVGTIEGGTRTVSVNQVALEQEISKIITQLQTLATSISPIRESLNQYDSSIHRIHKKLDSLEADVAAFALESSYRGGALVRK